MAHLTPDDGVARVALGFGKAAADKEGALRFSPRYPKYLPQFKDVVEVLDGIFESERVGKRLAQHGGIAAHVEQGRGVVNGPQQRGIVRIGDADSEGS